MLEQTLYERERDKLFKDLKETLKYCFRPSTPKKPAVQYYVTPAQPSKVTKRVKTQKPTVKPFLAINSDANTVVSQNESTFMTACEYVEPTRVVNPLNLFSLVQGNWRAPLTKRGTTTPKSSHISTRESYNITLERPNTRSVEVLHEGLATYEIKPRKINLTSAKVRAKKLVTTRKSRRVHDSSEWIKPWSTDSDEIIDNETTFFPIESTALHSIVQQFAVTVDEFRIKVDNYCKQELQLIVHYDDLEDMSLQTTLKAEIQAIKDKIVDSISTVLDACDVHLNAYASSTMHEKYVYGPVLELYKEDTKTMSKSFVQLQSTIRNTGVIPIRPGESLQMQDTRYWRWNFSRFESMRKRFEQIRTPNKLKS